VPGGKNPRPPFLDDSWRVVELQFPAQVFFPKAFEQGGEETEPCNEGPNRGPAMNGRLRILNGWGRRLLALLVIALAPAGAAAESITVASELVDRAVVVQMTTVIPGRPPRVVRSEPVLVKPGATSPAIPFPGDKIIDIYDSKAPNVILFHGAIKAGTQDQYLVIVPDKGKFPIKLDPRKPPAPMDK
jgi:hypothetical protein